MSKLVIALCSLFVIIGCTKNDTTVRSITSDAPDTGGEGAVSIDSSAGNKEAGAQDSLEHDQSSNVEMRAIPHSDSSDAIPYPLTNKKDTLRIGKDTITVSVADTPANSTVAMLVYTEPDTVYQYYRGVNTTVDVLVNQDTVLTQSYTIDDVLDAHGGNPEHSEVYVLTGVQISLESGSTRVAIQPSANIPDTDARLLGEKTYVYNLTESGQPKPHESID